MFLKYLWDNVVPKPRLDEIQYALVRLVAAAKRAVNEGVGRLVLGTLFATLCALSLRGFWLVYHEYTYEFRRFAVAAMKSQHEPRDGFEQFGITAAVLAEVNLSNQPFEAAHVAKLSHDLFSDLARFAIDAKAGGTALEQLIQATKTHDALRSWSADAGHAAELDAIRTKFLSAKKIALRAARPSAYRTDLEQGFGPPACSEFGNTLLHVSSHVESAQEGLDRIYGGSAAKTLQLAALIRLVAHIMQEAGHVNTAPDFVQAYFVASPDLLALWRPNGRPLCTRLPAYAAWSHANYYDRLLVKPESEKTTNHARHSVSRVYIDLAEQGFVFTACTPIVDQRLEGAVLVGAFCTDHKVPNDTIFESVARNPLLKARQVDVPMSDGQPDIENLTISRLSRSSNGGSIERTDTTESEREIVIHELLEASEADLMSRQREKNFALEPDVGIESFFLLPVGTQDGQASLLLVTPECEPVPKAAFIWLASTMLFGVSAAASGVSGRSAAKLAQKDDRIGGILRNLPTGVIVVSKNERIIEMNDRAEELFDDLQEVPKLGLSSNGDAAGPEFYELIEPYVVKLMEYGTLSSELTPFSEVVEWRHDGRPSTYFARQTRHGVWIRVSGTPMLDWRTDDCPETFGVVDFVTRPLAAELDAVWQKAAPTPEMLRNERLKVAWYFRTAGAPVIASEGQDDRLREMRRL